MRIRLSITSRLLVAATLIPLTGQMCPMSNTMTPPTNNTDTQTLVGGNPSSPIVVTNEQELRNAATLSLNQDVIIHIANSMTITNTIYFQLGDFSVIVQGINGTPVLTWSGGFDGNYAAPLANYEKSFFSSDNRHFVVRNVIFEQFHLRGAAIFKGNAQTELFVVRDCEFRDIGTIRYPNNVNPATHSDHTIFTQVIAAHNLTKAHIGIHNCKFLRCVTNQQRWSHCMYMSARSISVTDNTFDQCGHPFEIGTNVDNSFNGIVKNIVMNPASCRAPDGSELQPYLCLLGVNDNVVFVLNTVSGAFDRPWTGGPNPARHVIRENDYTQMSFTNDWGSNLVAAQTITLNSWHAMGFDTQ